LRIQRFSRIAGLTLLCGLVLAARPGLGGSLRDDRGVTVQLALPAARIVSLAPHLTEIAFAAGAGAQLVGVARFSDFPVQARSIQRIGDAARVDLEGILALKPDLILGWQSGNQAGDIARLEQLHHPVFVTEPRRLQDVPRLLRIVGRLAGSAAAAEQAAVAFEAEIAQLRSQYAGRIPVRVFYEIWHRPLLTVNGDHMISDVIGVCGGVNVFADVPVLTPSVSLEAVVAARPAAILGGSSSGTPQQFVAQWRSYAVAALRTVAVVYIAPDDIQRATPRILTGARAICGHLEDIRLSRRALTGPHILTGSSGIGP
jgi:iron complex transport system substrate-binding protein